MLSQNIYPITMSIYDNSNQFSQTTENTPSFQDIINVFDENSEDDYYYECYLNEFYDDTNDY